MKLPERMTLILKHDKSIAVELMIKEAQHYSFTLFFVYQNGSRKHVLQ